MKSNKNMVKLFVKALRETVLMLLLFLMSSTLSNAQEYTVKDIQVLIPGIQVFVNGQLQTLSAEPFIYENRVYMPLDAVSKMIGNDITLDPSNPYIYITRSDSGPVSIQDTKGYDYVSRLLAAPYTSYDRDASQSEIARLRYELEVERKKNETSSSSSSKDDDDDDIDELEDDLNDDYSEYTKGNKNLDFDIDLSQYSSYIRVTLEGDFDKNDSGYWDDRNKSRFQDYIEDICEEITDEFRDDLVIYVEDEDGDRLAKYEYDYSKERLDVEDEE